MNVLVVNLLQFLEVGLEILGLLELDVKTANGGRGKTAQVALRCAPTSRCTAQPPSCSTGSISIPIPERDTYDLSAQHFR